MRTDWNIEVCGNCDFRDSVTNKCKRFPPVLISHRKHTVGEVSSYVSEAEYDYPEVGTLHPACGEMKEKKK